MTARRELPQGARAVVKRHGGAEGRHLESSTIPLVHDRTLSNGLRLVVMPTSATGKARAAAPVAIELWVFSGTSAERPNEHGVAHLLEHMLFKPTAGGSDLAAELEALGGDVNAFTTHDETVFHTTVPCREWKRGLSALVRPVLRPALDQRELTRETQVVVEEIKQYDDDPSARGAQELLAELFRGHSYGRPVLGEEREVLAHEVTRLRAFHRRNYVPANMVLVVVGPIDPIEVTMCARGLFREAPRGKRSANRERLTLPQHKPRVIVGRDEVQEAQLLMAWHGPPFGSAEAVALEVAQVVLGYGEACRLMVETRRRDRLVSDAHASWYAARLASSFMLTAHADARDLERAAAALFTQIERLARQRIDGEELARARAVLESDLVYRRETVSGQAHTLGYFASLTGDLSADKQYYEQLASLRTEDVRLACAKHLSLSRAAIHVLLPKHGTPEPKPGRLRVVLARRGMARKRRARPQWQHDRHGIAWLNRASGLRLRAIVDKSVPMAAGWLVWPGGLRLESAAEAGSAMLTATLLTRGAGERDGDVLAREIDGKAAALDGLAGTSSLGLHFECLAQDAVTVAERMLECATAPTMADDELEEERRVQLEELAAESDDHGDLALRVALEQLYGAHPYARSRRGTKASLKRLTRAQLLSRWRRHYPLSRATLAVVGDVDLDALVELVEPFEHALRGATRAPLRWPGAAPKWPARTRVKWVRRAKAQAHVAIAYPGLTLADPRLATLEVMLAVLGGQSGRLFQALRENEGLVYHVSASSLEGVDAGHLMLYASASQAKLPRARAAIDGELVRLGAELVTSTELDRAKAWLLGQFETGLERRGRRASCLAFDEVHGFGHGDFLRYPQRVEHVSAAEVRTLARELFAAKRSEGVVSARKSTASRSTKR